MRWKNGGGTTKEIAGCNEHQRLIWRLSLADVEGDGPFSRFEGCRRILTVVSGVGMVLETPKLVLKALPCRPVAFSGDDPVFGRCTDGPVRNFNVIHAPDKVAADVALVSRAAPMPEMSDDGVAALYGLSGRFEWPDGQHLSAGVTALRITDAPSRVSPDARAVLVVMRPV